MSDCISAEKVQEAFLAAPPLIAQQILDLTVKHPTWMRDLYDTEEWPRGSGTTMQQLVFRGAMPQIERGFDKWKKLSNDSGCNPGESNDCSYNWTKFGGTAFERRVVDLMGRDFNSPEYCIHEIQTTAHFKEVFSKIVENLFAQVNFFKEINIGQNFLTSISKKYVVDSSGARANPNNPYVYRNIGTATLSALNITMLEFFYEQLRRTPDAVPYDVVDGAPIYSLIASHQLLARLYRDDQTLRQDVRFSGMANDLLTKYNFMSTIRGMFIAAPTMYPRRFIIVNGEPVEILPFVNGVPGEVGVYTSNNPDYENIATHEEVVIHGKHPFKVFYFPTEESLGHNTSFGPEDSMLNNWQWINPQTNCDPFRRVGYFASSAKLGLSQQYSEGVYSILVERPGVGLMFMQNPAPVCPTPAPVCNNSVPSVTCPCPIILDVCPNKVVANNWQFTFATVVTGNPGDPVQLALDNGGYVTGTLVALSADGYTAEITLPAGFTSESIQHIISVFCDNTLGCSAGVVSASDCRSGVTNAFDLVLSNPIKALTAGQLIQACFGDGTTGDLEVVSVDMSTLTWTLRYPGGAPTAEDILCDRGGIGRLCVPPTTDASCPACDVVGAPCSGTID